MTLGASAAIREQIQPVGADRTRHPATDGGLHRFGYVRYGTVQAIAPRHGTRAVEVYDLVFSCGFPDREPRGRFRVRRFEASMPLANGAGAAGQPSRLSIGQRSYDGTFMPGRTGRIGVAGQVLGALTETAPPAMLAPANAQVIGAALHGNDGDEASPVEPEAE